jgi:hypothetical protein
MMSVDINFLGQNREAKHSSMKIISLSLFYSEPKYSLSKLVLNYDFLFDLKIQLFKLLFIFNREYKVIMITMFINIIIL